MTAAVSLSTTLFRSLPADVVEDLTSLCVERRFRDGERIHARGDASDALYGVKEGAVRFSAIGPGGRELVLVVFSPGHWFGELGLVDGGPRTHHADAQGDTLLLTLGRPAFLEYTARHPEVYRDIALLLCSRLRVAFALIDDVTLLPLADRTAHRLLGLAAEQGPQINISQEELAHMVGASREAVGRVLNSWKSEGILRIGYGRITIERPERLGDAILH
jgi:CRP/FNR family cyclic AMP-dependent transcriptional regulator